MKPISGSPILTVASPPHAHCGRTIKNANFEIFLALLPASIMAIYQYNFMALRVLALSSATAILVESLMLLGMKRKQEADNFHALLCGLMFAFLLPPSAPWWLVCVGSFCSMFLGSMLFGGLGANPLCIPLVGWAICKISWPMHMDFDASMLFSSLSYPLSELKNFGPDGLSEFSLQTLLLGKQLGGTGAAQTGAIILGGIYLLVRKIIHLEIPIGFILGVIITAGLFNYFSPEDYASPTYHILCGATLFGAFFLATDGPSSPAGRIPMFLFGLICGFLLMIIRIYGKYPDGTGFAILLGNLIAPLLEKLRPTPFGSVQSIYSKR